MHLRVKIHFLDFLKSVYWYCFAHCRLPQSH